MIPSENNSHQVLRYNVHLLIEMLQPGGSSLESETHTTKQRFVKLYLLKNLKCRTGRIDIIIKTKAGIFFPLVYATLPFRWRYAVASGGRAPGHGLANNSTASSTA